MKILLVEDNERVTQFVVKGLQEAGHTVDHAGNGRDGMFLAASEPYDVIIMDRMLPGQIDGLHIIESLRKSGNRTPILDKSNRNTELGNALHKLARAIEGVNHPDARVLQADGIVDALFGQPAFSAA